MNDQWTEYTTAQHILYNSLITRLCNYSYLLCPSDSQSLTNCFVNCKYQTCHFDLPALTWQSSAKFRCIRVTRRDWLAELPQKDVITKQVCITTCAYFLALVMTTTQTITIPELSRMMYLRHVNSLASSRSWRTRRTSSSSWSHIAPRPTRSSTVTDTKCPVTWTTTRPPIVTQNWQLFALQAQYHH